MIVTKEVGASYDLVKDRGTGFVVDNIEEFGHRAIVHLALIVFDILAFYGVVWIIQSFFFIQSVGLKFYLVVVLVLASEPALVSYL